MKERPILFSGPMVQAINGGRKGCTWADSPWVWRVEFRALEQAR